MKNGWKSLITVSVLLCIISLAVLSAVWQDRYLPISILIAFFSLVPFFVRFEQREQHVRELVLIALLAALAVIGRIPFVALPSVQPTTFVIIVSALALGAEAGFLIGAVSALVSNLFLGQGLWTPWQMFAWGLVGYSAGLLRPFFLSLTGRTIRPLSPKHWLLLVFGFVWGILFGWLMNLFHIIAVFPVFTREAVIAVFAASFVFDLMHALSNVVFLLLFTNAFLRILTRFCRKHGLFRADRGHRKSKEADFDGRD